MWRSFTSLAEADTRKAFFRTLRAVIDLGGQAVSANDRLYLTSHVPTLIVWGARDPFIPVSHATDAHKAMPASRLVVFDDVGHYVHCEAAERFVEVFVDFMTSTEPAHLSAADRRALLQSPPSLSVALGAARIPTRARARTPRAARLAPSGA
jgi:hypothetical protein